MNRMEGMAVARARRWPDLAGRIAERIAYEPNSGCHLWTGATTSTGYGKINIGPRGKMKEIRVHRYIWERDQGPIPDGLCVLHQCDTPACCNVDHLFLGTRTDNARDKVRKGRQARGPLHGIATREGIERARR